jgi:hypothetical protein
LTPSHAAKTQEEGCSDHKTRVTFKICAGSELHLKNQYLFIVPKTSQKKAEFSSEILSTSQKTQTTTNYEEEDSQARRARG